MKFKESGFVVKKLGGENAAEMVKSAQNVLDDAKDGIRQAVVISAMRSDTFNTTDELIKIGNAVNDNDFDTVNTLLKEVGDFHRILIKEKIGELPSIKEEATKILEEELRNFGNILRFAIENSQNPTKENDYTITDESRNNISIIGFGEVLSAKLFSTVNDSPRGRAVGVS